MRWKVGRMAALVLALTLLFSIGPLMESEAAHHKRANPCAAKANPCAAKMNPCNPCAAKARMNPCAAKMNPCNPCAAKARMNPCAAKMNPCNPCNPCAARSATGPTAQARMIIAKVLYAGGNRLGVEWKQQQLHIGLHDKTQYRRGADKTSASDIKTGEQIIVSMLDRGGNLSATYVYLARAQLGGNPCNPCAAKARMNPCNPCNPCAAKARMNPCNPCNPCAAKKMNPCNPCAAKKMNPCNPCAAKNPCNPCGKKR